MTSSPEAAEAAPASPAAPHSEAPAAPEEGRDWIAWYEDLESRERREVRSRILTATPDEVKADPELRYVFLFHTEDLLAEKIPGTRRLGELHEVVMTLRGRSDEESAETRRKAVHFMLAEYQAVLRDNPFLL